MCVCVLSSFYFELSQLPGDESGSLRVTVPVPTPSELVWTDARERTETPGEGSGEERPFPDPKREFMQHRKIGIHALFTHSKKLSIHFCLQQFNPSSQALLPLLGSETQTKAESMLPRHIEALQA